MPPCVLLTGATGRLGKLLLPQLVQGWSGGTDLYAAWHRRAPEDASVGHRLKWLRFDLERADAVINLLPTDKPLAVLHLACSMSNVMRTVLRTDCFGTTRFLAALKERMSAPVWFVHASSIDAERNDLNYGLGKSYVENSLVSAASPRFTPCIVRLPAVEGPGFERWHVDAGNFPGMFLERIKFEESISALQQGRPPHGTPEPIYLLNESAGRWTPGKRRRGHEESGT
jgi:nucleoside-diphosphate-sugar epimerase